MQTMSTASLDQVQGCLLGLALGDALGAPREGGPIERLIWSFIGKTADGALRWTDDTQMSIDVAESLLARHRVDEDDLAQRFASSYRWSRGYGPSTAKVLKRIARGARWQEANRSVHAQGSFGNGGAMRSLVVGLCFAGSRESLLEAAAQVASVTHVHAVGIEGAQLVALATASALRRPTGLALTAACANAARSDELASRTATAVAWLQQDSTPSARDVGRQLGNGIAATDSCATAIYLAARFLQANFEDLLNFVAQVGGDVDTIGAMAGGIWGACRGLTCLPAAQIKRLEQHERLLHLAALLHEAIANGELSRGGDPSGR